MDITFNCDKCGQHIAIDEAAAGQLVDCPKCGTEMEVPDKSASAERTPEQPANDGLSAWREAAESETQQRTPSNPPAKLTSCPPAATKPFSPKFVTCPHCGKDVFATDSACVHCGQKIHKDQPKFRRGKIVTPPPDTSSNPPAKLTSCPDCGREVSKRAATCPHCGAPIVSEMPPSVRHYGASSVMATQIPFDNLLAWYGLSIILPFIGFFGGIYLMAKKEPGHGVACMVVSIVSAGIWAAIIKSW